MLWFWRGLLSLLRIPSNKFMSKMIIITLIDVNNGSMCDRWQAKRLKGCKLSRELLNKKFISNRKTRSRRIFSLSRDRERERESDEEIFQTWKRHLLLLKIFVSSREILKFSFLRVRVVFVFVVIEFVTVWVMAAGLRTMPWIIRLLYLLIWWCNSNGE